MKRKILCHYHGTEELATEPSKGHTQIANRYIDLMPAMGPSAWAVYTQLARHADKQGHCYPGIKLLATLTRLSKDTVIESVKKLVKLKLVKVEQSIGPHGRRNSYFVTH